MSTAMSGLDLISQASSLPKPLAYLENCHVNVLQGQYEALKHHRVLLKFNMSLKDVNYVLLSLRYDVNPASVITNPACRSIVFKGSSYCLPFEIISESSPSYELVNNHLCTKISPQIGKNIYLKFLCTSFDIQKFSSFHLEVRIILMDTSCLLEQIPLQVVNVVRNNNIRTKRKLSQYVFPEHQQQCHKEEDSEESSLVEECRLYNQSKSKHKRQLCSLKKKIKEHPHEFISKQLVLQILDSL
jgi:hypothetical protein